MIKSRLISSCLLLLTPVFLMGAGQKRVQTPQQICDFLLNRVIVDFPQNGSYWKNHETGYVADINVGTRAQNSDSIVIQLNRSLDTSIKPIQLLSRLDTMMIENKTLFSPAVVTASVVQKEASFRTAVKVENELFLGEIETEDIPKVFHLPLRPTTHQDRLLAFQTSVPLNPHDTSLAVTIFRRNIAYKAELAGEGNSLAFLVGLKYGLTLTLNGMSGEYRVEAGTLDASSSPDTAAKIYEIGPQVTIIGIHQYRAKTKEESFTKFFLKEAKTGRTFELWSLDHETGLEALEAALSQTAFKIQTINHNGKAMRFTVLKD